MTPQQDSVDVERLRNVIDRDRYVVAIGLEAIRRAIGGHAWLLDGRGPYAWDDDDYRREFGAAISNVQSALVPLAKLAMDKSDCTTDTIKVQEARDAARRFLASLSLPITQRDERAKTYADGVKDAAHKLERRAGEWRSSMVGLLPKQAMTQCRIIEELHGQAAAIRRLSIEQGDQDGGEG